MLKHSENEEDFQITNNYKIFRRHRCYYPFCHRKFYSKGKLDNHISRFHNQNFFKPENKEYGKVFFTYFFRCLKGYKKYVMIKIKGSSV